MEMQAGQMISQHASVARHNNTTVDESRAHLGLQHLHRNVLQISTVGQHHSAKCALAQFTQHADGGPA